MYVESKSFGGLLIVALICIFGSVWYLAQYQPSLLPQFVQREAHAPRSQSIEPQVTQADKPTAQEQSELEYQKEKDRIERLLIENERLIQETYERERRAQNQQNNQSLQDSINNEFRLFQAKALNINERLISESIMSKTNLGALKIYLNRNERLILYTNNCTVNATKYFEIRKFSQPQNKYLAVLRERDIDHYKNSLGVINEVVVFENNTIVDVSGLSEDIAYRIRYVETVDNSTNSANKVN